MAKLRVHNISISLDGYVAGPNQSSDDPLGQGGMRLHEWVFGTEYGRKMTGEGGGETGIDNDFMTAGDVGIGATIMGRNMFGPFRGAWQDEDWQRWWGDNPPYHHDTFVMTHHLRPSIPMAGGTTFHFVDETPEAVLRRAVKAAEGQDVRLAGGASAIRQFLQAGLVDEMHLAVVPILLGGGERLYDDLGTLPGYRCTSVAGSASVTHVVFTKAE